MEELKTGSAHERLETIGTRLETGLNAAAERAGIPVITPRAGSMSCLFFAEEPVHNLAEAMNTNRERFKKYFHGMLAEGVYLAPSAFEAAFLSAAHTEADIDSTIAAAEKVMATL